MQIIFILRWYLHLGVGGQGRPTLLTLQMPLTFCIIFKMYVELQRQAGGPPLHDFLCHRPRPSCAEAPGSMPGGCIRWGLGRFQGGDNLLRLVVNLHWETRHQTLQIKAGPLIKMSGVFLYPPFFVLPVTPSHLPTPPLPDEPHPHSRRRAS